MAAKRGGRKRTVNMRKRHILVGSLGLLLSVAVHPADLQLRDGTRLAHDRRTHRLLPFSKRIFADAGYRKTTAVAKTGGRTLEIVKCKERHRFVISPKRSIVECTLAWISRYRRLDKNNERHARKGVVLIYLTMIRLMRHRLTAPLIVNQNFPERS